MHEGKGALGHRANFLLELETSVYRRHVVITSQTLTEKREEEMLIMSLALITVSDNIRGLFCLGVQV